MNTKDVNISSQETITLDSMTIEEFNSIMEKGLSQAKADQSCPVADVFADLRQMDME